MVGCWPRGTSRYLGRIATSVLLFAAALGVRPVAGASQDLSGRILAVGEDEPLAFPLGLALDLRGRLIVPERRGHRVLRIDAETGARVVIAGTGEAGFSGDGGPATEATLSCPDWVDVDAAGNLYIADRCNERIRRVDALTGVIETVAGNGERGASDDGTATEASLMGPFYLSLDAGESTSTSGLIFTDTDSHRVRRIDLETGRVTTLAGSGQDGFRGDGGSALRASFSRPHVAVRARNGDLLIGDSFNQRIRRVDAHGVVRTIAGSGKEGAAASGTRALEAPLLYFGQIVEESNGDLLVSEWGNGRVLRLSVATGVLTQVAPSQGRLGGLGGLVLDSQGRLIVTEPAEGRVLRIDTTDDSIEVLAGPALQRPEGR